MDCNVKIGLRVPFDGIPGGEVISGDKPLAVLKKEADIVFGEGVEGKSVIDIGAWNGFFSVEAKQRGARPEPIR